MSSSGRYVYSELDSPNGHCRVMEIMPGAFEDTIKVYLEDVELHQDHVRSFHALSYTWGSQENSEKVFVLSDGICNETQVRQYIRVTQNLASALRHLRKAEEKLVLWADAICVNQSDIKERSEQVQLMPTIYRKAAHVWVWIGPEADDSAYAIDHIQWWDSKVHYDEDSDEYKMKDPNDPDFWMANHRIALAAGHRGTLAYEALIGRPWFERTWVRQEIFFSAHKATVICGRATLPWNSFESGLKIMGGRVAHEVAEKRQLWYAERRELLNDLSSSTQRARTFTSLVRQSRRTKCSDPRDKIFAVLGMLLDQEVSVARHLTPDYSISSDDLFVRVSKVLMQQESRLNILESCERPREDSSLPSWAINWGLPYTDHRILRRQYADLEALIPDVKTSGYVLELEGLVCDIVNHVECFEIGLHNLNPYEISATIRRILKCLDTDQIGADGNTIIQNLIYLLAGGEVREHRYGFGTETLRDLAGLEAAFRLWAAGPRLNDSRPPDIWDEEQLDVLELRENILRYLSRRSVVKTVDDRVGLAPLQCQQGDIVVILIGLSLPAILRAKGDGRYYLVGVSSIHGLNWGEALVGPFPPGWTYGRRISAQGSWDHIFHNKSTDEITHFDPRVNWRELVVSEIDDLRSPALSSLGKGNFKRPDKEYFQNHGIALQTFKIT